MHPNIEFMNVIISANNLTKIYGEKETSVTALDNININFNEMQFTAIMGPSGSGKSTLLHCLAGLDRPSSGQIYLKDSDISKLNDKQLTKIRRDSFGFVFQAFNLIPTLTAEENITLPASIAGKKPDMDWVKKVVNTVDISDILNDFERHGYKVSASFRKQKEDTDFLDRYESLMRFLNP